MFDTFFKIDNNLKMSSRFGASLWYCFMPNMTKVACRYFGGVDEL